jgi:Cu(I)/Ag(I) efflux system membrane fusion protein
MSRRIVFSLLGALAVLAATGFGAYRLGLRAGAHDAAPAVDKTGRKVLYWHDPMVPGQKFDKPGKSPFMDMELVPVYADEGQAQGGVVVSPGVRQNLGMRIAEVRKGTLASTLDVVGNVAFNERDLVQLQARSSGYVEKLFVRAPLDPVRKGQPLLQLYVPDWVAAQEEYLAIKRMPAGADTAGLLDAARQRMRLAGMTDAQVAQVSARSQGSPRITVTAPADGVVSELSVREGMTVTPGRRYSASTACARSGSMPRCRRVRRRRSGPGWRYGQRARRSRARRSTARWRRCCPRSAPPRAP